MTVEAFIHLLIERLPSQAERESAILVFSTEDEVGEVRIYDSAAIDAAGSDIVSIALGEDGPLSRS